jgi:hypothetical protein
MSNLFWLSDAQMERLKPFFPKIHGKPHIDDRDRPVTEVWSLEALPVGSS